MRLSDRALAGLFFFVGSAQFLTAMVLGEALYPGYSVSENAISDLGVGPTAILFNASVFLVGLLSVGAAYFFHRVHGKIWLTILFLLGGIGAMGVGVFPETFGTVHGLAALVAFLFSNLAAVATFAVLESPIRFLAPIAGILGLVALGLFASRTFLGLGFGGMERMIVYPVLLWQGALGGHLMSAAERPSRGPPQT